MIKNFTVFKLLDHMQVYLLQTNVASVITFELFTMFPVHCIIWAQHCIKEKYPTTQEVPAAY